MVHVGELYGQIDFSSGSSFQYLKGFDAEVIEPVLYDSLGLEFSVQSGFYNTPFSLEIVAADPAWNVLYTLDGSNPQDSETAFTSEESVTILVDPGSFSARPATPAVIVRASAAIAGILNLPSMHSGSFSGPNMEMQS